ncbi:MAG TPA: HAMP domain-containing sensor histidine kinase [Longimicrobiaceae bacterium]|nr:HAMP domain-containing sensor histidine kinase [Longimicrobiaceae bacterium]
MSPGPRRTARRFPNWRFAFVSASLVGTMVLAAGAAWGLHRSWREHERSVDAALHEYVRYAARTFGEEVIHASGEIRLRALAAVLGTPAPGPAAAMPLPEFAARAGAALDDAGLRPDPWRGYFRLDPRDGSMQSAGAAARPEVARQLSAAVAARLPGLRRANEPAVARLVVAGEPVTVTFARQLTPSGETAAVLGTTTSRSLAIATIAGRAHRRVPLLPPSFISPDWRYGRGDARSDSSVSVAMLDHQGRVLYRSPRQFSSRVRGAFVFNTAPGGFVVHAALEPGLVESILREHRRDGRRRLDLLLPLLSILLAASAFAHLSRERELVRARRDFVAAVSHELRTPLAQIRMFSETLLLGRERSAEERGRWLGVIHRESRRLGDLVENVILFSNLEGPGLRLGREPTDLEELLEEVVEAYTPFAGARGARLVTDVWTDARADVDPKTIRQVVVNLLDNALKYGPRGQTVALGLHPGGPGRLLLSVTDGGPGVAETDRERVWEPFVRLEDDGTTPGSGLGLAVVRSIVALHGGTVRVEDAPGGGARFVAELPAVVPAPVEGGVVASTVAASGRNG